jgi:hypothetical protein
MSGVAGPFVCLSQNDSPFTSDRRLTARQRLTHRPILLEKDKIMRSLIAVLLLTTAIPASADPVSQEDKILALKLAYEANNRSMVGFGSYDFEELKRAAQARTFSLQPESVIPRKRK